MTVTAQVLLPEGQMQVLCKGLQDGSLGNIGDCSKAEILDEMTWSLLTEAQHPQPIVNMRGSCVSTTATLDAVIVIDTWRCVCEKDWNQHSRQCKEHLVVGAHTLRKRLE